MATERLDCDDFDGVYLLLNDERKWGLPGNNYIAPPTMEPYTQGRLVNVISTHAKGEIRGYVLSDGVLHLRPPSYTGRWEAMDHAVGRTLARFLGLDGLVPVAPYTVAAGGVVQPA